MWPTDFSYMYLMAGTIPLALSLLSLLNPNSINSMSLTSMFVVVNWLGYHLNPWLAFFGSHWVNPLLVDAYIDEALVFSTLSMIGCLIGAKIADRNTLRDVNFLIHGTTMPFRVNGLALCICIFVVFVSFIIYVGGPDQVLYSSTARGAGQFNEKTTATQINNINTTFLHFLSMALAVIATLYIIQQRQLRDSIFVNLGYIGLIIASLRGIHYFSRSAGLPLVIAAVVLAKINGLRSIVGIAACLLLSVVIGHIGYTQRNYYSPDLGNFVVASGESIVGIFLSDDMSSNQDDVPLTELNPFSGIESWTLKAWSSTLEDHFFYHDLIGFLVNLNPLPSIIFPSRQIGVSLDQVAGTRGITGITTPFLAEIYYVFGYPGAFLMIIFGYVLQHMDHNFRKVRSSLALIIVFFGMIAAIAGVQKSVRTIMRPLWYALFLYLIQKYGGQHRERANIAAAPNNSPVQ